MKLIKVLIIAFILFMSGNVNSAQILIEFIPNNEYYAQCNNNSKTFINTTSFSNGLNSVTGEYFGVTSISKTNDIIVFNGVYIGNNNQYTLLLRNTDNIKPRIIFNGGNNQLRFNKLILNNIDSLNINSNVSPIGIDTIEHDHFTNVSVNN